MSHGIEKKRGKRGKRRETGRMSGCGETNCALDFVECLEQVAEILMRDAFDDRKMVGDEFGAEMVEDPGALFRKIEAKATPIVGMGRPANQILSFQLIEDGGHGLPGAKQQVANGRRAGIFLLFFEFSDADQNFEFVSGDGKIRQTLHIDAAKAAHVFNPNFDVVFRNGIVGRRHRREVGGIESVKKMNILKIG